MFERFTKQARAIVEGADAEARMLGHDTIGREHLLIALAAEPGAGTAALLARAGLGPDVLRAEVREHAAGTRLDAGALASIGIDLDEVRRRVEGAFGPGALSGVPATGHRRFTAAAKKTLELSLREAIALGDRGIGAEHILLGVLRDPGEPVAGILRRHGHAPDALRATVLAERSAAA